MNYAEKIARVFYALVAEEGEKNPMSTRDVNTMFRIVDRIRKMNDAEVEWHSYNCTELSRRSEGIEPEKNKDSMVTVRADRLEYIIGLFHGKNACGSCPKESEIYCRSDRRSETCTNITISYLKGEL